jgi:hypothetical protein
MPNVLITPHVAIYGTPYSREMGGDTDRELPPLCRRTTAT